MHCVAVPDVLPSARHEPSEQVMQVDALILLYVPNAHALPVVVIVILLPTVCEALNVYVPAPPVVPVS